MTAGSQRNLLASSERNDIELGLITPSDKKEKSKKDNDVEDNESDLSFELDEKSELLGDSKQSVKKKVKP